MTTNRIPSVKPEERKRYTVSARLTHGQMQRLTAIKKLTARDMMSEVFRDAIDKYIGEFRFESK